MNPLSVLFIVYKSIKQTAFSCIITIFSLGLAFALILCAFMIQKQTRRAFVMQQPGFDAVMGPRSSQLQLVLNSIYHIEDSPGKISWKKLQILKRPPYKKMIKYAIPYVVGDNFYGYRIVGTTNELFTEYEMVDGQDEDGNDTFKKITFSEGRPFKEDKTEAVVGSFVAHKLNLKLGDIITPFHGLNFDPDSKHNQEFKVVGIMESTNNPMDHVIYTPIEPIYRMEGHEINGQTFEEGEKIDKEYWEISAVLVKMKSPVAGVIISDQINRGDTGLTMAFSVVKIMQEFYDKMEWVIKIFEYMAYLVLIVAAITVLTGIYNTMDQRRREFAIYRAVGANRFQLLIIIVAQSTSIAIMGSLVGYVIYYFTFKSIAYFVKEKVGINFDVFYEHPIIWIAPLVMIGLGIVAGILPAIKAYMTDVSKHLNTT